MAKNDILVRWKADTGNYDANIAKARRQLDGFAKDNLTAGGAMKQLTQSAVGAAAKFASFGAAIAGAMKVAKDAFMSNEQQLDEWNRTIESSKSVYNGFLDALNTGDMSGFFQNIDNIVAAARQAYDALDELQTFNAFNQRNVARTHREMTEALVAVREGTGTKEQAKAAANAYKEQLRERQRLESQAYKEYVNKLAQERGVSGDDLMKAMSGSYGNYADLKATPLSGKRTTVTGSALWGGLQSTTESYAVNETERLGEALRRLNDTELQQLQALGAQADKTGDEIAQVDRTLMRYMGRSGSGSTTGRGGGTNKPTGTVAELPPEGSILAQEQLVADLTKKWKNATDQVGRDGYLAELEKAQKVLENMTSKPSANPFLAGDPSKMGVQALPLYDIPESAFEQMQAGIREQFRQLDLTTLTTLVKVSMENGIRDFDGDFSSLREKIGHGMLITDEEWLAFQESFNEKLQSLGLEPIKLNLDTGGLENVTKETKKMGDSWQSAAQAVQSVGSAMNAIEDPAAKVAGTIAEAIASIAMGAGQAIASHGGRMENGGPWGWIAFAASATATMIATIASVRKATSHADGGIIPGNNLSGDNRLAWVNSGEVVLNAAQSDTLAARLQGANPLENMTLTAKVAGKDLVLAINNSQIGRNQGTLKFH